VTRLSRKVLTGGAAIALVAVSGAVFWALQNNRHRNTAPEELYSTDHRVTADGLVGLPRDYAGIPRQAPPLGSPLPGDLGRPMLNAGAASNTPNPAGSAVDPEAQLTAQVSENVFDTPTGKYLLIPQGARLIGQYDSQIAFGQSRVLLVWTRLIMPNGKSIVLERQPGADTSGYSGLDDEVDNHWGTLLKAALLSTLLSVGSEADTTGNENALVQAIRRGGSESFNQVGQRVVGRNLDIQPTLTIRPGFPVRVIANRDLVLAPYQQEAPR
jgi:type IV secretory pathway VirB10-like protein